MMWPLSRTTTPTTIDDTESMHTEIENLRKELELKSETLSLYQADMVKYVALFEEKEKVLSPWHRHHHLTPAHKLKSPPHL
mmetsp:Transcript_61516/g.168969  ORF Transcript_61516/g.168969 Transcript_61516/m.168969 type:complete len:81 (+) Transcript_61516:194-436(+)